jgi:hypothetical protein
MKSMNRRKFFEVLSGLAALLFYPRRTEAPVSLKMLAIRRSALAEFHDSGDVPIHDAMYVRRNAAIAAEVLEEIERLEYVVLPFPC